MNEAVYYHVSFTVSDAASFSNKNNKMIYDLINQNYALIEKRIAYISSKSPISINSSPVMNFFVDNFKNLVLQYAVMDMFVVQGGKERFNLSNQLKKYINEEVLEAALNGREMFDACAKALENMNFGDSYKRGLALSFANIIREGHI